MRFHTWFSACDCVIVPCNLYDNHDNVNRQGTRRLTFHIQCRLNSRINDYILKKKLMINFRPCDIANYIFNNLFFYILQASLQKFYFQLLTFVPFTFEAASSKQEIQFSRSIEAVRVVLLVPAFLLLKCCYKLEGDEVCTIPGRLQKQPRAHLFSSL